MLLLFVSMLMRYIATYGMAQTLITYFIYRIVF